MAAPKVQPSQRRRRHVRRAFDGRVKEEWKRYAAEPHRILRRALRERFLQRHLRSSSRVLLELGPGPGRFTSILRRSTRGRVVALDLSRESLRSGRRRARRQPRLARIDWVQGAGECLPLRSRSVDTVVALGNIVSFAARDGPALLKELGRVLKPKGLLLADFASPAGATQEFFYVAARQRLLGRVLRRPGRYFLDRVLTSGFQPLAPARLARWEFQFYTVAGAEKELTRAGFRAVDVMSVAPIAAYQDRVAAIARRERRTWETLLRVEEQVGRRPGVLETGHGFLVAAVRA
jgi:ubiquinone/menaquinone biosynthesis C-methylase UbiE